MTRKRWMIKNRQAKFHSIPLLILMMLTLLCGCRESLPVNTVKFTPAETDALRILRTLRSVLVEIDARDPETKATTVLQLCRRLNQTPGAYRSQELVALADELPVSWLNDPQSASGTYGGYRYVLVRGKEDGVYAIPEPGDERFVFYARLPAGLFLCRVEEFRDLQPVGPPNTKTDAAWRPLPVIK